MKKAQLILLIIFCYVNIQYGQTIWEETLISSSSTIKSVEPYIAVKKTAPNIGDLLAVYINISTAPTTIEFKLIRNGSIISSGSINNATDPSVAFDGLGNAYIAYLDKLNKHIFIRKSTDGGLTFGNPIAVRTPANDETDKPFIWIDDDPSSPRYNNIYVAYTYIRPFPAISHIEIAYSTNTGESFNLPETQFVSTPLGELNINAFPITNSNGDVFLFWYREKPNSRNVKFLFCKSTDGGETFSDEVWIGGYWFERPGTLVSTGHYILKESSQPPGIRITPAPYVTIFNNNIYLIANADIPGSEPLTISKNLVLIKSSDNGVTWEHINNLSDNLDLFFSYLVSDGDGILHIICYSSNTPPYDNIATNMRYYVSGDGGITFNSFDFGENFNLLENAGADFIGDYICMTTYNEYLYAIFNKPIFNGTDYKQQVHISKFKVELQTTLQNLAGTTNNLNGSYLLLDNQSYPSPSSPYIKVGKNISLQPEETFYDPWKFYKWQFDGARDVIRYQTIYNDNNVFKTNFHQTKPLTVRNYFEGDSYKGLFKFGEVGDDALPGDFQERLSPYDENAFFYNIQNQITIEYKANAQTQHTGYGGETWNFVKWEDGTTDTIRQEPIDENTSPEWKAMYKGNLTSDDLEGLSSNSQRKLVRTDDDIYHLVYESLGDVWYTKSLTSNFQGSWSTEISLTDGYGDAKNPSLDFYGNDIVLIFEYSEGIGFEKIYCIVNQNSVWGSLEEITEIEEGYFGNAKPVVAYTPYELFVCYRNSSGDGLKYRYRSLQNYNWSTESSVPGTVAISTNPTIASKKTTNLPEEVHIAYQYGTTQIKYVYCYTNDPGSGVWVINDEEQPISSGSGYTFNKYPSISLTKWVIYDYWDPVLSWTGIRKERER